MKKTISANIGGLVFSLEEDGYQKLHSYLESLKAHFSSQPYGKEVVSDIEARIAEQFKTKTGGNPNKAVTFEEVEEIIKSIGTIEDFAGEAKTSQQQASQTSSKRLYRSSDDVIIAGVASGIAAYFGWDVTLVRVLFALTVIFGGWGIPLYIVLWIVMPEAKTAGQKLEMQGKPVTIKEFEQTAKEKVGELRASGAAKRFSEALGQIFKVFARVILIIIGASFLISAVIATFSLTFSAANLLVNRNSPYVDFPFSQAFTGGEYFAAILLAFITALIPLIFLAIAGTALIRLKKSMNGKVAGSLAGIWVVAAIATSVFALNKAPAIEAAINEYKGNVETRTIQASNFTKVHAGSAYRVNINPGTEYTVTMVGHSRDLDESQISIEDQVLRVGRKSELEICFFCWNDEVTVNITAPSLEEIRGSGAVKFEVGRFSPSSFGAYISGASRAAVTDLATDSVNLEISGASSVNLTGSAKLMNAKVSGASRLNAFGLAVDDATVSASGSSRVEVNAGKTISAEASGASRITYRGNPAILKDDESGSSRIRPE